MKKKLMKLNALILILSMIFSNFVLVKAENGGVKDTSNTVSESDNEILQNNILTQEKSVEEEIAPSIVCEDVNENGRHIRLELSGYEWPEEVKGIVYAVWSAKNDQDDLIWHQADADGTYLLDTSEHNDEIGTYIVHAYAQKSDGTMQYIVNGSFEVEKIVWPEAVVTAGFIDENENQLEINVSNYEWPAYGESLEAAIWSSENGQDDLKWYSLKYNTQNTYSYIGNVSDHKSAGTYQVHVYLRKKNGAMQWVGNTSFEVSGTQLQNVKVDNINTEKGTCQIRLEGVSSPSGIQKIEVPIWNQVDQSDIIWYQAEKIDEKTYIVNLDIAKHGYRPGIYYIHVYTVNGNNVTENLWQTSVDFSMEPAEISWNMAGNNYILHADNIKIPGGVQDIIFAVWSEKNGQDDVQWYTGTYQNVTMSGSYTLDISRHGDFGKYFVHCYVRNIAGQMVFLGATDFSVKEPVIGDLQILPNNASGKFNIVLENIDSDNAIKEIQVPVWSEKNQSDIVWYKAVKDKDGNYVVNGDISNHAYHTGPYTAHAYITDINNLTSMIVLGQFSFETSAGEITVGNGTDETYYHTTIHNVVIPGGVKKLQFAVWSVENNQDDIYWYTAVQEGNADYSVNIDIRQHKTLGKYMIHVYAENKGGQMFFLGQNQDLEIHSSARITLTISDVSESQGSFLVTAHIDESTSTVNGVRIPVWCASDQNDIVWYNAKKQSDNTYTATVQVSNHKGNLGNYKLHAYATFANGISLLSGTSAYEFNPSNFVTVLNDSGWGTRRVILKNAPAGTTNVRFPVWSNTNGQDDIVWYDAVRNADGSWEAIIQSKNHRDSGLFHVHCYANGVAVRGMTFNFPAAEFGKNGWYYENGYKLYYDNDQLITDVSNIIGPQSEYMAKVNRVTCTVTIYAKDGANGFIIPVKVFACSVGLPGTETPLGTYHTLAKYRWHELMGPSYGQYCTRIVGGILFHSVAGYNMTSYNLSAAEYNKLGSPASHGCVRLNVRDAKWIYDNCRLGMTVVIYDSNDPGPFGKPATIKIPASQNWDPTDPNV